jgi:eukaryotic-like serine/threonine-protein kinase
VLGDREGPPGVRDPHVAAVTEAGETSDGLVYLVMAPFDGTLLADLVQPGTTRPPGEVAELVRQAAEGLAAAHAAGVAHGALSLTSLMVVGGPPRIVVLDLGLAALLRERAPAGKILRHLDPHTTAPEVLAGAAPDARSDVYSLGAVAHRLLTGFLPTGGSGVGPPTMATTALPAEIRAVLDAALAPSPADRLDGVRALAAALAPATADRLDGVQALAAALAAAAAPASIVVRPTARRRSHASPSTATMWTGRRMLWAALGLAVTVALLRIVGTRAPASRSSDDESGLISALPPITAPTRLAVHPSARPVPGGSNRPVAVRRPMLLPGQRVPPGMKPELVPPVIEPDVGPPAVSPPTDAPRDTTTAARALVVPTPTSPAASQSASDAMLARVAASQAVGQVARAVEARDLAALTAALPELTDDARTGWAQLFEVARDLRGTLTVRDVVVRGVMADAQIAGAYEFWNRSLNRRERVPIAAQATLVRDVGGWRMRAWR